MPKDWLAVENVIEDPGLKIKISLTGKAYETVPYINRGLLAEKRGEKCILD